MAKVKFVSRSDLIYLHKLDDMRFGILFAFLILFIFFSVCFVQMKRVSFLSLQTHLNILVACFFFRLATAIATTAAREYPTYTAKTMTWRKKKLTYADYSKQDVGFGFLIIFLQPYHRVARRTINVKHKRNAARLLEEQTK